jgi:pantoate--beta-alanine ligase
MKVIDTVARMMTFSRMVRKEGKTIGLVPTMGYLHEGHLSLVKAAKISNDIVVMSIFVNPIQFGPKEDYNNYPRDLGRDEELARSAGVDVTFYPSAKDIYPEGYATYVNVEGLAKGLCGKSRPGHFRGVTTVVAKLFGIVKPDAAYFGQKDAQQAAVIKKMAEDLNMDIDIRVLPTVREADGLAKSSRNKYLSGAGRRDAAILYQSLLRAQSLIKEGEKDPNKVIKTIKAMIKTKGSSRIDYVSIVDPGNLKDVATIKGPVLVALAVFIGKTRLIDNVVVNALSP